MTAYQPGIPVGTTPLDQDYLNIQANFQQLDTTYGVDHIAYSTVDNNGYHTSVHLVPVSTTATNPPNNQPVDPPATTAGIGQVFSAEINDGATTDTALYFLSGDGVVTQLTTPSAAPVAGTSGYTFLPGGLILQWGFVVGTHGSDGHFNGGDNGNVLFVTSNIDFPKNCFNIWAQPFYTGSGTPTSHNSGVFVIRDNFTNLTFHWHYSGSTASYTSFSWWALGN